MRKIITIIVSTLILVIAVIIIVRQNYKGSPDYNYITAKLDIRNGNIRIIKTGNHTPSSKDKEIDLIASKYGFKYVYIGYDTTKQKMKGINNYNEVVEAYLVIRNGNNWQAGYQKEVDSVYKAGSGK